MLTSSPVFVDQVKQMVEHWSVIFSIKADTAIGVRCYCSVKAIDGDGLGGVIIVAGAYWVTWQPAAVMTRR